MRNEVQQIDNKVEHDYRLHGDNMNEVLPPDYQEFLDSLPAPTEEELKAHAEAMEKLEI